MQIKTTNPFKHPFPHAKLYNVKLTSITRLTKNTAWMSDKLIPNDDPRNWGGTPKQADQQEEAA